MAAAAFGIEDLRPSDKPPSVQRETSETGERTGETDRKYLEIAGLAAVSKPLRVQGLEGSTPSPSAYEAPAPCLSDESLAATT
jgi:hypothetical protein